MALSLQEFNQQIHLKFVPALDPNFKPAAVWLAAFAKKAKALQGPQQTIAIMREHQTLFSTKVQLLPLTPEFAALNFFLLERLCKYLLWSKGGHTIFIPGQKELAQKLQTHYQTVRKFDDDLIGVQVYGQNLRFTSEEIPAVPPPHFPPCKKQADGCRVGIDLGGSDRKFAAVKDGEVVQTGEILWDPYHQPDPNYHLTQIDDCIAQAAQHLDHVDAIGVSSAGIYVANEVKVGSLFRGVAPADFKAKIAPLFKTLQKKWGNVPLVVANDGDVTALAAAYSSGQVPVLGVAMGTSLAAGYINENYAITGQLNELAFVPVDFRPDAPCDEWSQDSGVGVNYFSQQAVARLIKQTTLPIDQNLPFPQQLVAVQELMKKDDPQAAAIYETIGTYLGYTIPLYYQFDPFKQLLLLGRVMTGKGGEIMQAKAQEVLAAEFPSLAAQIHFGQVSERDKRHGQAVAAAFLPEIKK